MHFDKCKWSIRPAEDQLKPSEREGMVSHCKWLWKWHSCWESDRGGVGCVLLSILVLICWDFPTQSFLEFTKERSGKEKRKYRRERQLSGWKWLAGARNSNGDEFETSCACQDTQPLRATVNAATNWFRKLGMGKQVLNSTATIGWNECTHPWHSPMWS